MIITIIFDECCRNLVAVIPAKCARDSDATTDPGFEVRGGANGKWIVKIEYGGGGGGGGIFEIYDSHSIFLYIFQFQYGPNTSFIIRPWDEISHNSANSKLLPWALVNSTLKKL